MFLLWSAISLIAKANTLGSSITNLLAECSESKSSYHCSIDCLCDELHRPKIFPFRQTHKIFCQNVDFANTLQMPLHLLSACPWNWILKVPKLGYQLTDTCGSWSRRYGVVVSHLFLFHIFSLANLRGIFATFRCRRLDPCNRSAEPPPPSPLVIWKFLFCSQLWYWLWWAKSMDDWL